MVSKINDIALDLGIFALNYEFENDRKGIRRTPKAGMKVRHGYSPIKVSLKRLTAKARSQKCA